MEAVPVIARGKLRALRKPRSVGPHDTDGFVCQSVATALDSFALIVFPGRAVHAPEIVRDAADIGADFPDQIRRRIGLCVHLAGGDQPPVLELNGDFRDIPHRLTKMRA